MARAYRRADQRNNDTKIGLSLQPVEPGRLDGEREAALEAERQAARDARYAARKARKRKGR